MRPSNCMWSWLQGSIISDCTCGSCALCYKGRSPTVVLRWYARTRGGVGRLYMPMCFCVCIYVCMYVYIYIWMSTLIRASE